MNHPVIPQDQWRAAVEYVSGLAQARLPTSEHGRLQMATGILEQDMLAFDPEGRCRVLSSTGDRSYIVNGTCECEDYQRHSERDAAYACKHRYALMMWRRSEQHCAKPETDELEEAAPTIPEELKPFIVMIQGKPFVRYPGLLALAHAKGLQTLEATWTFNDTELSLAEAVASFKDGRIFKEAGDASPSNVTRKVAPHFRRVALTRAKARVLRDALAVHICCVDELGEE